MIAKPKTVKETMIPTPNSAAWAMALLRLRKSDITNGIIGKTQGVKIAAKPKVKATKRNRPRSSFCGVLPIFTVFDDDAAAAGGAAEDVEAAGSAATGE